MIRRSLVTNIRDYCEEYPVEIEEGENGRLQIVAMNEGGYNCTKVDLLDVIAWAKENMPEIIWTED